MYRYSLDATSKKFICPGCGRKTLVRYKNNHTGEYLPPEAGRCDRENNCGYHHPPKKLPVTGYQFHVGARGSQLPVSGLRLPGGARNNVQPSPSSPETENAKLETNNEMQFLPLSAIERCEAGFPQTSFMQWLIRQFGNNTAIRAAKAYLIGRSKQDGGKACIFWQIDIECNVRTGKIMHYNAATGKRIKDGRAISFVHAFIPGFIKHPCQLCFFGEHLLCMHPTLPVAVVESEKTAIVCFLRVPNVVWLATGGLNGCGWQNHAVYKALAGRNVTFYPDYGFANRKTGKTCYQHWLEIVTGISDTIPGQFKVSDLLERHFAGQPRNDEDIADLLTGVAGFINNP